MRIRLLASVALTLLAFAASAESRPLTLAWDANTESNIGGYMVVYGSASHTYTTNVDVGNKTSVSLSFPDAQPLYIAVKAYNTAGLQSPPSSEVFLPAAGSHVTIEAPSNNGLVTQPFIISGWAADPGGVSATGVDAVNVYAYPGSLAATPILINSTTYGAARPDVANYLGGSRFTPSGFSTTVTSLKPGTYVFAVFAHSTVTGAWLPATRTIRIGAGPVLFFESPQTGNVVGQPFLITGYALDTRAKTGTGVDAVTISYKPAAGGPEILLGYASYTNRPDVTAAYGSRFTPSGFIAGLSTLPAGTFTLIVRAHSTVTKSFVIAASATIYSGPVTAVDVPDGVNPAHQGFTISGWSIDRRSASGSGISRVDIYAYPSTGGPAIFLGTATPNQSRPDVAAAYGAQFVNSGYSLFVGNTLAPGRYLLVLYPLTTVSGAFATPSTRAVDVLP